MDIEKLKKANEIVKKYVEDNFEEGWVYTDFAKEDRFLIEITEDEHVDIKNDSVEDLAEYAIEQICNSASRSRLFGF